jgi:hypothetical protein
MKTMTDFFWDMMPFILVEVSQTRSQSHVILLNNRVWLMSEWKLRCKFCHN